MLDLQLRTLIAEYLAGDVDMDALEEGVVTATWTAERDAALTGAALGQTVMLAIAELDRGDISEDEFRLRLEALAPPWAVPLAPTTGSASPASRADRWMAGAAVVRIGREAASV